MHTIQSSAPQLGIRASASSPVIIATDGHKQSDAALAVGRALAGDVDSVHILTVLRTMPVVSIEGAIEVPPEVEQARCAAQQRMVEDQASRVWRERCDGADVELAVGDPATVIARIARDSNATMIVAGLGRHRVMDRLFGDETALRLIRVSSVPVLAVADGSASAPQRIVVAIDFSETSRRAARLALEMAAPHAVVYLVHVAPRDSMLRDLESWGSAYKSDAGDALQKLTEELRVPRGAVVQRILLQGDPATELLAFAASANADLIATGSHGHGFVTRLLVGSVATRLLRCATCSVLAIPHAAAMTHVRTTIEPSIVNKLPRQQWTDQLDQFSRRNLGRRGTLEVDDPEIGAQAQENDYPLLGAAFDSRDRRVKLMFGELGVGRQHLSRSIGHVVSIDTLTNEAGRDVALRIAHGAGQTLLTFST